MLCSVEMTQAFISNETNIELAFIYVSRRGERMLRAGFAEDESCRAEHLLSNDIKYVMIR